MRALIKTNGHERRSNFMHCYVINIERGSADEREAARLARALISEIRGEGGGRLRTRKLRFHSRHRACKRIGRKMSMRARPNALPSAGASLLYSRGNEGRGLAAVLPPRVS